MKTEPFLYNNGKPAIEIEIEQKPDQESFNDRTCHAKLEFIEIVRQDSPARFMKINTDLLEEAGIFKNDIIVIDPQEECVSGKIIVAKVNDALVIRRYEKIKSGSVLYGDAKKISPLKIEEGYDQFKILGVVTYIVKSL